MSELNESQKKIAETIEGMIVVDAGPGTGKTMTITDRYVSMMSKPDVSPKDVLMLTFTRNAAQEMTQRITAAIMQMAENEKDEEEKKAWLSKSKLLMTKTFDSFCLSIVKESAEEVGEFFGIKHKLTRSASIQPNQTINNRYFRQFLEEFLNNHMGDYGEYEIIASQFPMDVFDLINKLMSKGIVPLKRGWFGYKVERELYGNPDLVFKTISQEGGRKALKRIKGKTVNDCQPMPDFQCEEDFEIILKESAYHDREGLVNFIHDVYHAYISKSIADNYLTYGLTSIFAFTLLYSKEAVRQRNSFKYVMIDEFQDTNSNQLMISLMILKEPNLCVVGDWKQGIYGFRYVSIDNIVDFENRVTGLRKFLNDDMVRIPFSIPEPLRLPLDINYRSSQMIIDEAFNSLYIPGNKSELLDTAKLDSIVTRIKSMNTAIGDDTKLEFIGTKDVEDEAMAVASCVRRYVGSGKYPVKSMDRKTKEIVTRDMNFGDIAVMCRTTADSRHILEVLTAEGIPAYLQGDVEIMSTREGKLALAWLRFVNNDHDRWGYVPIMADLGYNMATINSVNKDFTNMPCELLKQRESLYHRRRRVTSLMTSLFSYYGLDNDITQTIISVVSSSHRGSLMTLSDIIAMMEEDIENRTVYSVEGSIDRDAVTIMTMHKSKGLEFPAVIIPFIDQGKMPNTSGDKGNFIYNDLLGIRCTRTVADFNGYRKMVYDWRTLVSKSAVDTNYDEERRLMFVALSRAKQYECVICGPRPSMFMLKLSGGNIVESKDCSIESITVSEDSIEPPATGGYKPRRIRMGVHDIMNLSSEDGVFGMAEGMDEPGDKGMAHGSKIHEDARRMYLGMPLQTKEKEHEAIRRILDSISDADAKYAEVECSLPLDNIEVTLRGIIDLIAVYFDDRIEIHDYKTDSSDRFESEYRIQLSIYAHAAMRHFRNVPKVVCIIDYLNLDKRVEFDPLPIITIEERVQKVILSL